MEVVVVAVVVAASTAGVAGMTGRGVWEAAVPKLGELFLHD